MCYCVSFGKNRLAAVIDFVKFDTEEMYWKFEVLRDLSVKKLLGCCCCCCCIDS